MLHVALWEPEIPPNTGNIARLCAATNTRLHLIGKLGFRLDDRALKRAGLDYWHAVDVVRHVTFADFERALTGEVKRDSPSGTTTDADRIEHPLPRVWCVETPAERPYTRAEFADGDCLLFGSESSGLPPSVRERYADRLVGIPMPGGAVRSLNLATAVGIVLYDALRRLHGW
ncbi:tRNA (cytidine(34)-2'-O)-methyltransferase [Gemmata obscuriglobus]|uniref:Putative tRNA (cytidine(34)-2'-O)-methyltransferase n=1 Tax=Gemmata obscuriglobus TaxID=114 RepID=A0A2Z3HE20_9BACT|nr:tRNA (cytidine(34)-2'-O)-methyltransferase [Gemmata obscuriglobus]AWM41847.1 tRNA (cytidine(34)-2'-O)-methyltransferase [Gemmata obscuriglobus]QEG32187.1 tRNA (cytidine(34)-2'-O)-methyltransferase [Gemmata obscuriglobus]VTS11540.1 trna methyltransferase : Putative tRNA (cytidine(34)-2'-O)-methyltransferase OS=Dictyoglomus turgidum (strain Z-1310 / DSM 6724) GN=Dtur_0138 PE=3 SV=1: SpoU_methylase [Gemmata obscuriglobus UQM 2246]